MKILNNLRNRYSFNFLAAVGLINLLFYIYLAYCLFDVSTDESHFYQALFSCFLFVFDFAWVLVITFIVALLLHIFLKQKITNEKFLNSKLIFFLQNIGIIFAIIPILFLLLLLLLFLFVK